MKKSLVILLVALVAVSLFVGCKNEPEEEKEVEIKYEDLLGTWRDGDSSDFVELKFTKVERQDGTLYGASLNEKSVITSYSSEMTFTLKDNVITFTSIYNSSNVYNYKVSFNGQKLVIKQIGDGTIWNNHTTETEFTMSPMS